MKNFAAAIFEAEKNSKRDAKFAALSGFGPDEKRLVWNAYNPYRVFNVRKYPWPKVFASVDPPYGAFFSLLDQLHARTLTGNAARDAVTAVLGLYTEDTAKALARVLDKDLKCGASVDSFVKIYKDLDVPSFGLMLAAKVEEKAVLQQPGDKILTEEVLKKKYGMAFPVQAEAKYDGTRLVAVVNGGVEYFSRSGKPSDHCTGLFDDELAKIEQEIGPFILDGEAMASSFQETMNAKGSKNDDAKANLTFRAFDIMTLDEWESQDCKKTQTERSEMLANLLEKVGTKKLIGPKTKICHNMQELLEFHREVLADGENPDGTKNGRGEGLIIKRMDGLYEWERSKSWFKWKPVLDLDLHLVGFEYGKGRLASTVGKVHLRGFDENGTEVTARCGSGLDDKMRAYLLEHMDELLEANTIVHIECQELTLAQGATVHSARFPIWIKIRADK